ncbi:OmpP1/FadL family transporter [Leptospira kobayashii]|uniref:OmpP1/FadL family transporter n=1 Tax=Leptospira kobayashii TaxID=1917830 RepID=UPI000D59CFBE|nr:outer membrane protein transport protein [Leptospira kobayashii]
MFTKPRKKKSFESRRYFSLFLFSLFAIFFFISEPNFAITGSGRSSINARYEGLGGLNTALGGSPIDVSLNPANLYLTKGRKIEFGGTGTFTQAIVKDRFLDKNPELIYGNSQERQGIGVAPYFAAKLPITDKIDYGFAFYVVGGGPGGTDRIDRNTPTGQSVNQWAKINLPSPLGDSPRIKETTINDSLLIKVANGASVQFGKLSLGATMEINYGRQSRTQKYFDASGRIEIPGQGYQYESKKQVLALGGIFGLNYSFTDWFRMGYSYQSKVKLPLDGHYSIGVNDPQFYEHAGVSFAYSLPEKHSLGFAYSSESVKFGVDFTYVNYKSYLKSVKQSLEHPWFVSPFGNSANVNASLNYQNQAGVTLGLEHQLTQEWIYRLGYCYNTPITSSAGANGAAGIIFSLSHTVSAGFSYRTGPWSFDLGASYSPPGKNIEGARSSDWALLHGYKGDKDFNFGGYSFQTKALAVVGLTFGITRSFDL